LGSLVAVTTNLTDTIGPFLCRFGVSASCEGSRPKPNGNYNTPNPTKQAPEVNVTVTEAKPLGWCYFGAKVEGKWAVKNFEMPDVGEREPRRGDVLIAKGPISIRVGPMENNASGWVNQPEVGKAIKGHSYFAKGVSEVYPNYYWVEIEAR
jgi:hypothetical protein